MKLNPFKTENKKVKKVSDETDIKAEETKEIKQERQDFIPGVSADNILKGFYISEKSALAQANANQYVFKVYNSVNKSEVKKAVARVYGVKVKEVKMLNMPRKRRDLGKHPGYKSGFKKAIVTLEKGHTIKNAQA